MEPKIAANYRHFVRLSPHQTKVLQAQTIPLRYYDEDTHALILALIGMALVAVATLSTVIAFAVF